MRPLRLTALLLGLAVVAFVALAMFDYDGPARVAAAPDAPLRAELHRQVPLGEMPGRQVAFSPDGRLLAAAGADGSIRVWRVAERGPPLLLRHEGGATSLAFSGNGAFFASGGYDGQVRLWDAADGHALRTLSGHQGTVWTVAVSSDGKRVASGGEDRILRLWSADDGKLLQALKGHKLNIWSVRFSPDGRILASGSFDHRIRLWDGRTGERLRVLRGHDQAVVGLAFSPDGALLASGGDDSAVRLWRVADGAPLKALEGSSHVYSVAFSPDGKWLAAGGRAHGGLGTFWRQATGLGGGGPAVRLWDVGRGEAVQTLDLPSDAVSAAFSPDGKWLAASTEAGGLSIWRLRRPEA